MQGVMVVPDRRRSSYATSYYSMGQAVRERDVDSVTDSAEVTPVGEFDRMQLSEEEALAAYQMGLLLLAIRAKVTYLGLLSSELLNRPDALAAWRSSGAGERANVQLTAVSRFAKKLSLPNNLKNLQNLVSALEVNILPKRFGLYVRGTMPLMKIAGEPGTPVSQFYGSRVQTNPPPGHPESRVVDFGDLSSTSVIGDMAALERIVNSGVLQQTTARLGEPITLTVALAWAIIIVIAGATVVGVAWSMKAIFSSSDVPEAFSSPGFMDWVKSLPPDQQVKVLDGLKRGDGFFEKVGGLITTLIVGAVVVTVAGVGLKLVLD